VSDELQQAQRELAVAIARAEALGAAGDESGTDLVPARSDDPVQARRQLAAAQAELLKTQEIVRRASERLEQTMRREMDRVRGVLAPLDQAVKQLQQGLFSINLYLGRDEEIVHVRHSPSSRSCATTPSRPTSSHTSPSPTQHHQARTRTTM
jgi:hypothetical protein